MTELEPIGFFDVGEEIYYVNSIGNVFPGKIFDWFYSCHHKTFFFDVGSDEGPMEFVYADFDDACAKGEAIVAHWCKQQEKCQKEAEKRVDIAQEAHRELIKNLKLPEDNEDVFVLPVFRKRWWQK